MTDMFEHDRNEIYNKRIHHHCNLSSGVRFTRMSERVKSQLFWNILFDTPSAALQHCLINFSVGNYEIYQIKTSKPTALQ